MSFSGVRFDEVRGQELNSEWMLRTDQIQVWCERPSHVDVLSAKPVTTQLMCVLILVHHIVPMSVIGNPHPNLSILRFDIHRYWFFSPEVQVPTSHQIHFICFEAWSEKFYLKGTKLWKRMVVLLCVCQTCITSVNQRSIYINNNIHCVVFRSNVSASKQCRLSPSVNAPLRILAPSMGVANMKADSLNWFIWYR